MVDYNETVKEIRLRYVGTRFDEARMPVDVLPDLPAFRDLLAALVKDEWRRENAMRQRLPKGFDRSFTFDLRSIGEGSAIPMIEWNRNIAQESLLGMADYLESLAEVAMTRLLDIVDGSGNDRMPRSLPSDAIRALNKFGSSLRDGERIEFQGSSDDQNNVVYLDAERRKRLITHVKETYNVRVEGVGKLHGTSLGTGGSYGSIEIDTTSYGIIEVQVDREEVAQIYDGNIEALVQFDLTLELDHHENFRGVQSVHEVDLVDEANATALTDIMRRITEISSMQDGWLDGDGEAISPLSVEMARKFVMRTLTLVGSMLAFPSPEGSVTIQIRNEGYSGSIDFEPCGAVEFVAIGRNEPFETDGSYNGVETSLIVAVTKIFGQDRR
jgi:hypothetical protein